MGIITKEVEIKLWGNNIKHYHDLGYDGKHGDVITVKVEDLSDGSRVEIQCLCDYCKKEIVSLKYSDYTRRTKEINKISCRNCFTKKMEDVFLLHYGVSSYSKTKEYKEKWNKTCEERYGKNYRQQFMDKAFETFYDKTGYNYPSQSPDVREKMVQSCIDHYGVSNPQLSLEIREKTEKTNLERYGYISPSQSSEVKTKAAQANLEKYGCKTTLQLPEVREKITQSFYKNSSQKASKQQQYINDLYRGILNFPVKYYNADIYLSKDNIIVEYDGGGHSLNLVMGRETEEEYTHKKIVRYNVIKKEGYKQMYIISSKDLLPIDEVLLQMLSEARNYFSKYPNHSWIEFDIDKSTVRNAEYKNGIYYDFGKLRTIKNSFLFNKVI